ncbi:hypothetical protein KAR91_09340 [Candidatus Pacearchaeota archaeon]|nr:hypothetical protein [Candidatus Pacearchaeota archaeon]
MGQVVVKAKAAGVAMAIKANSLFQAPFKGYLTGIFVRGAGLESVEIESNRSVIPTQQIPCRDIAVTTDPLQMTYVPINQPMLETEIYNVTPAGTGTARVLYYFFFTRKRMGSWILWQKSSKDTSAIAAGESIQRIPDGAELLAMVFARGPGLETLAVKIGTAGIQQDIPGRAIALNTDAEPFQTGIQDIMEPSPSNQEIILVALEITTGGASAIYSGFQMSAEMEALVIGRS